MVLSKYRCPSHDDDDDDDDDDDGVDNEQVGFALLSNDSSDIPWSEKLHQLAHGMISISQTPSTSSPSSSASTSSSSPSPSSIGPRRDLCLC